MQCKCGSETWTQTHEVISLSSAVSWFPEIEESQLPIMVEQEKCVCTRIMRKIYSNGELVYRRG